VRRTVFQAGFVAALAEPVAEAGGRERSPDFIDEEGKVARGAGIDDGLQFWMHGKIDPRACLFRRE